MHFALPTRVAATALFERVRAAVRRMFPDQCTRPAVVLAVPGYARRNFLVPVGLTRFGGHPEAFARGATDAKNTPTVFA